MPYKSWLLRLLERVADELNIDREMMLGAALWVAQDMAQKEDVNRVDS